MICPICNNELDEKIFMIPFEVPYFNVFVCRNHLSAGYQEFLNEFAEKLAKMYLNGEIAQNNKKK
jgi:hypothetical protein